MPTYDYECDACGHAFEQYQQITAEPIRKCPQCGKKKVRRLIGTGAGVIFKGSGFYQTDYRSESYKRGAEKEKTASAGTSAGTGSTTSAAAGTSTGSGSGGGGGDKSPSTGSEKKPAAESPAKVAAGEGGGKSSSRKKRD